MDCILSTDMFVNTAHSELAIETNAIFTKRFLFILVLGKDISEFPKL